LKEGEEVVLNPKALLGEKAKTRQATEAEQGPGLNGDGEAKPKGKGKNKGTGAIDVFPKGASPGGSGPPVRGSLAK
jgi:hypothetical protein